MKKFTLTMVLVLSVIIVMPLSAQKLGYNGVGVGAGLIFPQDWDTGFDLAGYVNMGELSDNLVFVPGLAYWSAGTEVLGVDVSFSNIAINADVHYFFERKQVGPYAGGGLGFNILTAEVALPSVINPFTVEVLPKFWR